MTLRSALLNRRLDGERFFQAPGLLGGGDGIDEVVDAAAEEAGQVMPRVADAVVGDAVLGEVVGADLLSALAAADLGAARIADLRLLLFAFALEEAGAQDGHGLDAVLELRALVLALDGDASGHVGDAHRRGDLVDVLAAGAAGVVDLGAQVLVVDVDLDLLGLRQDGDGGRAGVDAALRLGGGDALDAVGAALVLEAGVSAAAMHLEDDLLEAALLALARGEDVDGPALRLGVAGVHAIEVGREEGRLLAAGAGADLDDDVALVVRVGGQQGETQLALAALALRLEHTELVAGEAGELRVRAGGRQGTGRVDLRFDLAQGALNQHAPPPGVSLLGEGVELPV